MDFFLGGEEKKTLILPSAAGDDLDAAGSNWGPLQIATLLPRDLDVW